MTDYSTMAARVRHLRRKKAATENRRSIPAQEVADAVGIARSTLAGIESGHYKPGRETMIALAQYYGVPVDYIAGASPVNSDLSPQSVEDPDELALLSLWRTLNHDERKLLLTLFEKAIRSDAA